IAAEVGYHELALHYFHNALFVDLADLHGNTTDGVHVASTGGVWAALVYGFGGMRDHNGTITFDPRLPDVWPSLTFRITVRGTRLRVVLEHQRITFTVEEGDSAEVIVRGHQVVVDRSGPVTVELEGQGPRLTETPRLRTGEKRPDGTLITATVPAATA